MANIRMSVLGSHNFYVYDLCLLKLLACLCYDFLAGSVPEEWKMQEESMDEAVPLAEALQRLKMRHADTVHIISSTAPFY